MYYTDDSLYPENMQPLIITAAPYGPSWIPGDADIPVTWKEQVQVAVDCYNAGATHLHIHVRNPATGKLRPISTNSTSSSAAQKRRAENDHVGGRLHLLRAKGD